MERPFQYLEPAPEPEGTALGVGVSLTLHVAALLFAFLTVREAPKAQDEPLRYVELIPQSMAPLAPSAPPRNFVEAPGPAIDQAPSPDAALSDANRRASTPSPTGTTPTRRPGDGSGSLFVPATPAAAPGAQTPALPHPPPRVSEQTRGNGETGDAALGGGLQYRVSPGENRAERQGVAESAPAIDWQSAIREAGKVASPGTDGRVGGEQGFAESGPISFESQWYDWGPYAAQMVAKIRLHWYNNMPEIIRMGMKGVVVIRFTIQRDGSITDITTLESSGIPPYDFAARKAIELASPLSPLPADFNQPYERVTAGFYYNANPPR